MPVLPLKHNYDDMLCNIWCVVVAKLKTYWRFMANAQMIAKEQVYGHGKLDKEHPARYFSIHTVAVETWKLLIKVNLCPLVAASPWPCSALPPPWPHPWPFVKRQFANLCVVLHKSLCSCAQPHEKLYERAQKINFEVPTTIYCCITKNCLRLSII